MRTRLLALAAVALLGVATLAACGDDDDGGGGAGENPDKDEAVTVPDGSTSTTDTGAGETATSDGGGGGTGAGGAEGGTPPGAGTPICETLAEVDGATGEATNALVNGGAWAGVQQVVTAAAETLADLYEEAAARAPAEVADDFETLIAYSELQAEVAGRVRSPEEFASELQAAPTFDAGLAALAEAGAFAQENCGLNLLETG